MSAMPPVRSCATALLSGLALACATQRADDRGDSVRGVPDAAPYVAVSARDDAADAADAVMAETPDASRPASPVELIECLDQPCALETDCLACAPDLACGTRGHCVPTCDEERTLDGFRLVAADYEEPFPAGALAPLVGVTEVTGDIEMTMVDVRDLRALSCLRRVGGNLDIGLAPSCVSYGCWRYPFEALESFDGLENLREVGGVLGIHSTSIRETTPLAGLESAGALYIQGNMELRDLEGLEGLTTLGNLQIEGGVLASLTGLRFLTNVDGDAYVSGLALADLSGLGSLATVGGDFSVYAGAVVELTGLEGLVTVGGVLRFSLASAPSIANLDSLTSVGGLELNGNTVLEDLTLPALVTAGPVAFLGNPVLRRIELPSLARATEVFLLTLPSLEALDAPVLVQIDEDLELMDIPDPVAGSGLRSLRRVGGTFAPPSSIASLASLQLSSLEEVGGLRIRDTDELANLAGLDVLRVIAIDLELVNNARLESLQGLGSLARVDGRVEIAVNPMLTTLDGLSSLVSTGTLYVANNDSLTSLSGLVSWSTTEAWEVTTNASLPACEVAAIEQRLGIACAEWGDCIDAGGSWCPCSGNDGSGTCP